jgi:hypothetical protein
MQPFAPSVIPPDARRQELIPAPQTAEMPRADLRLNVSSDASAARSEALGATVRKCGSLDALEALRADPSFKADFKALPLALQATIGAVISKTRQQLQGTAA